MLREHRRNVCKIRVEGEYLQTFLSRVLTTSRVGYCAGKPIESALYCSYKIRFQHFDIPRINRCSKSYVFDRSGPL